ncbi:MAG TPA: LamG domain-containing protein [Polyangiaceae bacterium]|jgi:hypothetical protein
MSAMAPRAALLLTSALLAGSWSLVAACSLVAPLDGLAGGSGGGDAASERSGLDAGSGGDAASDAANDAPRDATADTKGPADAASDGTAGKDAPADGAKDGTADATDATGVKDGPPQPETGADTGPDAPSSVYRAAVLADDPLAYWRLDETSGTVAHDETGHGHDGTYVGTFTLGQPGALAGDPDTAVGLDGVSGHVDVGLAFDFSPSLPFTLEGWVNLTTIDATYRHVVTNMQYGNGGMPFTGTYIVYVQGSEKLGLERWSSGTTELAVESTTFTATDVWAYVVGTFDGTTGTLYVNGVSQAAATSLAGTTASGVDMVWGDLLAGTLDEIAVYDHALPQARVTAHYAAAQ